MFIYALKSAIVLTLLYLPYLFLLGHESLHRFNRYLLIAIMLLSLALPLCNLPFLSLDENAVVGTVRTQLVEAGIPVQQTASTTPESSPGGLSWFPFATGLYAGVTLILLSIGMHDFFRLRRIMRTGCLWQRTQTNGITIFCHSEDVPSFSWMRNIVISESDYRNNGKCIIQHECGHILQHHFADLFLLYAMQMIQWFNPLVWKMGASLRDLHEYEADAYVLHQGIPANEYRELLIAKALGGKRSVFASNFNNSLLKKRIRMMYKKKSSPWNYAKSLYLLPLSLLSLCVFATPQFKTVGKAITRTFAPGKPAGASYKADQLVGAWVQPVPGQTLVQGMRLEPNGKARSINMATLQYSTWDMVDGFLVLTGKSIGNGGESQFTDTLEISQLTENRLQLKRGSFKQVYSRQ